ncbi:MAG: preprotein translocase subunit SecG [Candidatus Staskawiczbacteria bacterium RIFCSPLOWO2_01_FULL_38_12b]|uniref:Protein-export membrane protein SecG n=1 Tax=Candidatus Staskawiczbacteria bacterium RIFCSPLOWO2_01_FULL_38_12b TaxID=1802214 RepID=A0A1G2ICV3_9BACT|nr:MAG: preprotein translocase subunit SecG [Candidatus Staskawiczbacteria bacterium RIFCSPLOWO2_01_FULL_38_12b]
MIDTKQILFFTQIAISVILIVLIAVQQRGTALGAGFGGSGGGESYSQRRGIQKKIYYASIVIAALFIILGILNLLI